MEKAQERRSRLLGDGDINVSFEFFPPKTEKMEEALWSAIRRLEPLRPKFVSVTYGAGGSTRERTHNTVARLAKETALVPAAHLTCVAATKGEVNEVASAYKAGGREAHRGAARRSVGGRRHALRAACGRLCQCGRAGRGPERRRRLRDFGRGLSRAASRERRRRGRPRQPEGQGGCGRLPRHHAVLFRQRALPALPGGRARQGHLGADRAGHRADS